MRSVLVVDDEKLVRWSLTHHLRKNGYAVASVESAEEALEELRDGDYDVVISDIRLPGIDGIELLKRLLGAQPEAHVIMITAHDSPEYRQRAAGLGAHEYVKKPFSLDSITAAVGRCMTPHGANGNGCAPLPA